MLFYLAKVIQATGLIAVGVGFVTEFPKLMDPRLGGIGLLIFLMGWMTERFLARSREKS